MAMAMASTRGKVCGKKSLQLKFASDRFLIDKICLAVDVYRLKAHKPCELELSVIHQEDPQ